MRKITLNDYDMRDCEHSNDERITCGTCGRMWCGICNPTPSARCLYEYEHDEAEFLAGKPFDEADDEVRFPLAPHGGCNWKGCRECFPNEAALVAEAEEGYDPEMLKPRKLPHIGMSVCYHDDYHGTIVEVLDDGDVKLDNGEVVDFNHCCEPLPHSTEYGTAHPCPTCGEYLGFHNDDKHRKSIPTDKLLEKGWHLR